MATDIKLTKCKGDLVDSKLAELELDTNGSLKVRVGRLAKYYEGQDGKINIANCDQCGADSDAALDSCPFCGDEGAVEGASPMAEVEETEDDEGDDLDQAEQAEVAEVAEGETMNKKATKKATKKAATAPKKAAKPAKAAKPGKPGKKPPEANRTALAPVVDATGISVVDSTALDAQVEVIREAVLGGAVALHRLGTAANTIVTDSLWKQRVNDDGVPAFRSFKQFCVAELGLTAVHVYRAMKVSDEFTEGEITQLSGKQVRLVLEVPKESRQEVIAAAQRGESGGKLTQRANELRGGRKPLPEPSRGITVAVTTGHTKLKMFKRPNDSTTKVGETEGATPAKRLADAPWAVMDLTNKVRMLIRISTKPNGEIIADVEFRRGETVG